MVLRPSTAGEAAKVKSIVRSPFDKKTPFAGLPFTVKSLASRVVGSTGSLKLTMKSVGGVVTMVPQASVLTEQGGDVGVDVGLGVAPWIYLIVAQSELVPAPSLAPVTYALPEPSIAMR
jgi:hypothetical protein